MSNRSNFFDSRIRPGQEVLGAVNSVILFHEIIIQGKIVEEGMVHLAPEVEAVDLVEVLERIEKLELSALANLRGHLDGVVLVRVPCVIRAGLLLHRIKRLLVEALGRVPT